MAKLHTEPDPAKRSALRKKLKGDKSDEEFWKDREAAFTKMGKMSSWEREREKGLAEGMMDKYFDNKDGIGAVPFNQEIDYMGFVTRMTPREFRRIVPAGVSGPKTKEYVKQALQQGKKLGTPFLEVKWDDKNKVWQTTGHEGRSRVDAIAELFGNDLLIPIHIFPGGMRARDMTDEMKKAPILPQRDNIY
jgi:hypothetical protein